MNDTASCIVPATQRPGSLPPTGTNFSQRANTSIYSSLQDDFKTVESYKPPMVNCSSCHWVNHFIHDFELLGHPRRVFPCTLTEPTENIRLHHRHRFLHAANQGRYAKPKVFAWLWVPSGLCSCSPWRPRHCVTLCWETGREWLVPGGHQTGRRSFQGSRRLSEYDTQL